MNITDSFRNRVFKEILNHRANYGGSDASYASSLGLDASIFSRLKNGQTVKLISDSELIRIGIKLNVSAKESNWKTAQTTVWHEIEENLNFCQRHSKAMILIDMPGIGKSYCSKRLAKRMKNAFYFDCSQAKTKQHFVRALADTVGVDSTGRFIEVKTRLKYYLNVLENPLVILDDAGYLDNPAFLEIQELWNGTEGSCGWYMIGDDSLRSKIERGIQRQKIGYAAIFSRFSEDYVPLCPIGLDDKKRFLTKLIGDVASANLSDQGKVQKIVRKCMVDEKTLRNVDTIIRNIQDGKTA